MAMIVCMCMCMCSVYVGLWVYEIMHLFSDLQYAT